MTTVQRAFRFGGSRLPRLVSAWLSFGSGVVLSSCGSSGSSPGAAGAGTTAGMPAVAAAGSAGASGSSGAAQGGALATGGDSAAAGGSAGTAQGGDVGAAGASVGGVATVPCASMTAVGTPTNVTLNGSDIKATNVNGLTFKGFGVLSGNGTSELLLDYKS